MSGGSALKEPQPEKRHDHYFEVAADDPRGMGLALGRAFGTALKPFLKDPSELPQAARDYLARCLDFTQKRFPDYVAEIEGYAAGAGVETAVLWRMLLEDDLLALAPQKCTSFATNGGRLLGHNEDWDAGSSERLFILRRTLRGRTVLELHYAGTPGGNAISINSSGVAQMINSVDTTPLDTSVPRVPTNIIARIMSDCEDMDESLAAVRDIPRMGGYAHTLVSRKGEARLAEMSQKDMAVRDIATFPFVHANHYVLEEMTHHNGAAQGSTRQRYAAAASGTTAQMNPQQAMKLLEDGSGGPACGLLNDRTIAGVVADLDARAAWIRLVSEPEKGWLKYDLDFLAA